MPTQWDSDPLNASASVSLPIVLDPRTPSPQVHGPAGGCYVTQPVVETGFNEEGYYGIRIRASVHGNGVAGLRLGANVRRPSRIPILAADEKYRASNGQAAVAVDVPATSGFANVAAFIPFTALALEEGNQYLQILVALFDSSNQQIGICRGADTGVFRDDALSIRYFRGPAYLTRVEVVEPAIYASPTYPATDRQLKISFRVPEAHYGLHGKISVFLKDESGRVYLNPVPVSFTAEDSFALVGLGASRPRSTAEIAVNADSDSTSDSVSFKLP